MFRCNSKRVWRRSSWQKLNSKSRSKIILLEQPYDELKTICTKLQDESGATDLEVKTLLWKLARVYEKDIDDNYDIDWEV